MDKRLSIIVELCFIIAGFWGINYFVDKVLAPDYTANWQVYPNWDAVAAAQKTQKEDATIVPQETKDGYLNGIMTERKTDRLVLFLAFGIFIAAYYCTKAASNEIKRRGVIIPADGTERLDAATIASNRRIAGMRFVAVLLFMMSVFLLIVIVVGSPMARSDATGKLLCVNTNPYCSDDNIDMFFFIIYFPVALLIAPHFVLRKISNIYSLKYSLTLFAGMMIFMCICVLLHISPIAGGLIASGSGLFASYNRKMSRIANILGI